MPASPIRKLVPLANEAKRRGLMVYHLNIGQPDISTFPEIFEAFRAYREEVLAYGPSGGIPELIDELRTYYGSCGIDLSEQDILVTTGGSEAIIFAMMAICDCGDEILVFEPFYTNYNGFAVMADVRLVPVPTSVEDGFRLPTFEAIRTRITPRTRGLLLCTPNNPTGTVYTQEEMARLVEIARRFGLFLLSDEVYREFVYDGKSHVSLLHFPGLEEKAIMLDSISKRFSACGARVGCLVSRNRRLTDAVLRFGQARLCPPTLEQVGAIAGYRALRKYAPGMIAEYERRRNALCEELRRIRGAVFHKPEGAFYMVPQLPIEDADAFASWMLSSFEQGGKTVMVAPGEGFYATPGKGRQEVRIAYVLKEPDLRDAMQILRAGIEQYPRASSPR
jgi:aspartate aminotransferase